MDQSVFQCFYSVNAGLSEIRNFDFILASGNLDDAADRLIELWNKLYDPTQILSELYDGEFWNDWQGRAAFEVNLKTVYEMLNENDDKAQTIATLEVVRDYLHANFSLLNDAIRMLTADIGTKGLYRITNKELL